MGILSTQRPKCKPVCMSTWLTKSIQLHQEQNILTQGAINKPTEDKKSKLNGERTRATLHIRPVTQPQHQSLVGEHCNWVPLIMCMHVCSL